MSLMDVMFARNLVEDALRTVLEEPDLTDEHVTLVQVGLVTQEDRRHFRRVLHERIVEEGYVIEQARIPSSANDTIIAVASALPGHSTKGNPV